MLKLFKNLGRSADFKIIKQLDSSNIKEINSRGTVVFTDMGSGQLELIKKNIKNFYIIDHHPPVGEYENQVNPHFYGYDGGCDVSGAGMTYFVAKSLGCKDIADIAIVGAVGDMQDSKGKFEPESLNRKILSDGTDEKILKIKYDLRLFGRQSRPLPQMLAFASEPVLPGLTGNPSECIQFIKKLGIELDGDKNKKWKRYIDLTHAEREKLRDALYIHLLNLNTPEFLINKLVGEVYTLLKEEKGTELRDAKEFATVMNACGRQENSEIGVKVCIGDRNENWKQAKRLLLIHRQHLREGLDFLRTHTLNEKNNLYYFDAGDLIKESIVGVVAGMAYGARIIPPDKPVLALADDKDDPLMKKVSARANWGLIRKGIHLGNAMRSACEKVGGEGGGHDIAAGARIPKEKEIEFLNFVDEIFGEQVKK
jgi:RecJ-like exonuclease